jgi:type VI secretion system secreted protein VgrG
MNTFSRPGPSGRRFTFSSGSFAENTFEVVRFEGEEALSALYRFELLLASRDNDIRERKLVGKPARFTLNDGGEGVKTTVYRGLLKEFSHQYQIAGWTFFRAVLVPKFWRLETFYLSEVYLDKSLPEIFRLIMKNAGLTSNDYVMRLKDESTNYLKHEYICQYQESYLSFIARWTERLGIYWWYEEIDSEEKIVFSDTRMGHKDEALALHYQASGELDAVTGRKRRIQSLVLETRSLPRQVVVMDYNAQRASHEIKGAATVEADDGIGVSYLFGENLKNNAEAAHIAKLRAESIRCRGDIYRGSSTATGLHCGKFIEIKDHYRTGFNRRYLLTQIRHQGSQAGLLWEGIGLQAGEDNQLAADFYIAEITAIDSDVQFRAEINHAWPKIDGTLNAFIDSESDGQYAELNHQGEYKIQVPFDITEKGADRGSAWVRMATPYAGEDYGMHFPLHKDTEVLLSFVNGNPDQPVIIGAVHNSVNPNVVTNNNQTQSRIHSSGGNQLTMEDRAGNQRMYLGSPTHNTWMSLGAVMEGDSAGAVVAQPANVPAAQSDGGGSSANEGVEGGFRLHTDKNSMMTVGNDHTLKVTKNMLVETQGDSTTTTEGSSTATTSGDSTVTIAGNEYTYNASGKYTYTKGQYSNLIWGWKNELSPLALAAYGAKSEYVIISKVDFWTASKFEFGAGLKMEVVGGAKIENISGLKSETVTGVKMSTVGAELKFEGAKSRICTSEVKNGVATVKFFGAEIKSTTTKVDNTAVAVKKLQVDVNTAMTHIAQTNICVHEIATHVEQGDVKLVNKPVIFL